jgi:RNA polymerase sigma factor (TIGR02999 family)
MHSRLEPNQLADALRHLDGAPDRARELDRIFPLVYRELRAMAARQFARESPGHTLQPTALVHEAWLRLTEGSGSHWSEPRYFFAAAAEAMRRILIERARTKGRPVRAAWRARVPLDMVDLAASPEQADWSGFDEALRGLAEVDADAAEVVRLRVYAGLEVRQAAAALGVSEATVKREWRYARAWLGHRLGHQLGDALKGS